MKVKFVLDRYCGVNSDDVRAAVQKSASGISISERDYDAVVIIGGDGSFLNNAIYYRKPVLPLEGIHKGNLKSVGVLTEHKFSDMPVVLKKLAEGDFRIIDEPILKLRYSGKTYSSIGDFYVERGDTKEAVRYTSVITDGRNKTVSYAISNGFIVTTPIGSTGYFSYLDKIERRQPKRIKGIGFAHILPSMIKDVVNGRQVPYRIRRVFPLNSKIRVCMERNSAYLFGIPKMNLGIRVKGCMHFSASSGAIRKIVV